MSLVAAAQAGPPAPAKRYGKIDSWLAGLEESERDAALRILRDPAWEHERIRELFLANDLEVSPQSIGQYRKKLERESR
jgi:hypothetical protein